MLRTSWILLAACLFFCSACDEAQADLFSPGSLFTVNVTNDPLGNNFTGSVSLTGGPTTIDNGLLTVSETIMSVNASTAWIEFDFNATGSNPLVGRPSNNWEIEVSSLQTTAPTTLTRAFFTFDVNGVSTPFPFSGSTITTNPITGMGQVALSVVPPPYTYSTLQTGFAQMDPFNQGPTDFGTNPSNTPSGFSMGVEYQLQPGVAVPEPSSVVLMSVGLLGLAGWRRRRNNAKALPQGASAA